MADSKHHVSRRIISCFCLALRLLFCPFFCPPTGGRRRAILLHVARHEVCEGQVACHMVLNVRHYCVCRVCAEHFGYAPAWRGLPPTRRWAAIALRRLPSCDNLQS